MPSPLPDDIYASYFLEISVSTKAKGVNEWLVNYQLVISEMVCLISIQQYLSYAFVSWGKYSLLKKQMQEVSFTMCSPRPCFWFMPEDVKFKPQIEEHNVLSLLPLFWWPELEPGPRGFCSQGSALAWFCSAPWHIPGDALVPDWRQWPQRSFSALFLPLGNSGAGSPLKHHTLLLRVPGCSILTHPSWELGVPPQHWLQGCCCRCSTFCCWSPHSHSVQWQRPGKDFVPLAGPPESSQLFAVS